MAGIDQDELLDPDALADPDSSFYEINGVSGLLILLLHGFGASVFSWSRVMRPVARIVRAKVLAFDRPAFGLTSRASWSADDTKPLNQCFK